MSRDEARRRLRRLRLDAELWALTLAQPALTFWLWLTKPLRRVTAAVNRYMMRFRIWRCCFVIAAFGITQLPAWVKKPAIMVPGIIVSQVVLIGPLDEIVGFVLLAVYVAVILIFRREERRALWSRLRFAWSRESSPKQIPGGVDAEKRVS